MTPIRLAVLALALPTAVLANPPAPGRVFVLEPGTMLCTAVAMTDLAATPESAYPDKARRYVDAGDCGHVAPPGGLAMTGRAIDAGIDDEAGGHFWALEVISPGLPEPQWMLYGEQVIRPMGFDV